MRARGVDPLPLLGVEDLETLVRRAALRPPPRPYGSLEGLYKRALAEVCSLALSVGRAHYVEYLAGLARALDPIPVMALSELLAELRRRALPLPERGPWDTDPIYAGMCAEVQPRRPARISLRLDVSRGMRRGIGGGLAPRRGYIQTRPLYVFTNEQNISKTNFQNSRQRI